MPAFTTAQLDLWLSLFMFPFFRFMGFMLTAPLLGHSTIPATVKIGLGIMLTVILVPALPTHSIIEVFSWQGFGAIIIQTLIGSALGLTMRIVFVSIMAAGDFIGLQMGLAFATFISPDTGTNIEILARFFNIVSMLLFLALGGHLMVIEGLFYSFQVLPIDIHSLNLDAFSLLLRFSSTIFSAGLVLALPLGMAHLIINLGLGILNRSAPQMTVFSVGFPTSMTLGILLLSLLMSDVGSYLNVLYVHGFEMMQQLIEGLAPIT